jgi:hypothetical protein
MMLSPPSSPSIANTLSQRHVTPSVNRRRPLLAAVPSPRLLPPDLFSLIFFAQREEELRFTKRSYNNSSPAKLKDDGDGIAQWQWNARKNGSDGQVVEHILNIDLVEIQLFQTTSAIKMITVKKLNIVNVQSVATTAQHQVLPVTAYVPSHSRDIITSQVTRDIFYTDDVETEHRTLLLTSFCPTEHRTHKQWLFLAPTSKAAGGGRNMFLLYAFFLKEIRGVPALLQCPLTIHCMFL